MLPDLQKGRILAALDEVAGVIDHEQPHRPAANLAPEQQRDARVHPLGLQTGAQVVLHLADGHPRQLRRAEHGRSMGQGLALARFGVGQPFLEDAERHLSDREVAGAGHRQNPFARRLVDAQLAIGRDVVEPGVGAGVGQHHQAFVDEDSGAVGHVVFQTSASPLRRHAYA